MRSIDQRTSPHGAGPGNARRIAIAAAVAVVAVMAVVLLVLFGGGGASTGY